MLQSEKTITSQGQSHRLPRTPPKKGPFLRVAPN
eukprot:UN23703